MYYLYYYGLMRHREIVVCFSGLCHNIIQSHPNLFKVIKCFLSYYSLCNTGQYRSYSVIIKGVIYMRFDHLSWRGNVLLTFNKQWWKILLFLFVFNGYYFILVWAFKVIFSRRYQYICASLIARANLCNHLHHHEDLSVLLHEVHISNY